MMDIFRKSLISAIAAIAIMSCSPHDRYITISGYAQGGTYTVKLNMNGRNGMIKVSPEEIRDSVNQILLDIDNALSGYNMNSLLSRFNNGDTIIPDTIFIDIYGKAAAIFQETAGAVDAASAPLFDLWGFGFKESRFPSDDEIEKTREASGMERLKTDIRSAMQTDGSLNASMLLKEEGGMTPKLNYNAIAQGYSCDVVAAYLYSIGVKDMMVDIGEIFCDGLNPSRKPWTLGIDRPLDGNNELGAQIHGIFSVPACPQGIVTSGNYRKFYIRDGKKYAHTIDPRTGYPVSHNLLSATIAAPDAMTADAYATYCMVIGLEEARKFIEGHPDIEGCLIYDDHGTFKTWCSEFFKLEEL